MTRTEKNHARIAVGESANLVIFRGRYYSEVLSRPQLDRVVIRDGRPLSVELPDYRELDPSPPAAPGGKDKKEKNGGVKRARGGGK